MKRTFFFPMLITLVLLGGCRYSPTVHRRPVTGKYVLVIHGGAGTIKRERMTQRKDSLYRKTLQKVLDSGEMILKTGGSALDAVTKCITLMENSPLFNAGRGSVFTAEGKNEMDASLMNGKDLSAGAVASVSHIKNPILAARAVMEHSPHVLLVGEGAEQFAKKEGLSLADSSYFFTRSRWNSYLRVKAEKEQGERHGTVGAVALDMQGNLAAGTSTGGMTYKMHGRVGDSPIIGAGTYADNASCAVSATGHGEYFIRNVVAYQIGALMDFSGFSLKEAANYVILDKLKKQGADGGIIAVDNKGNFTMTFNTDGMFRGFVTSSGFKGVYIYKDE